MERVFRDFTIQGVSHSTHLKMEKFENGNEIVRVCSNRKSAPGFDKKNRFDPSFTPSMGFEGVKSLKEATDMLSNGWTEKVDVVKKSMEKTQRLNYSNRVTGLKTDVVGCMPIVPHAIMGLPNSMLNTNVKPKKNKVIDLVYGLSYSAYVDTDDIIKVGLAVMENIIQLESQGFRVRLTAMQDYTDEGLKNSHIMLCKCKSEDQPLDAQRVMFPMFHPAMFRMIGFGWYETLPESTYIYGYGKPLNFIISEDQMKDMMSQVLGRTSIYINGMSAFKSSDPKKYIASKLEGLAI